MTSKARPWLLAAILMPANAPLAKRLEILGSHLKPKPGTVIEISPDELRDRAVGAKDPGKLFGFVEVRPPKGQCFTVTTKIELPDITVCKPTSIKWFLEDLDKDKGTITWTIRTGPNDFGTPATWSTPYAIAKVLPPEAKFKESSSTPVFLKSCVASQAKADGTPRKITLTQFNNHQWILRFPEKDTKVNLKAVDENEVLFDPQRGVSAEKPEEKKPEDAATADSTHGGGHGEPPPAEASGHGGGHGETPPAEASGHGGGHGETTQEAPAEAKPKKDEPEEPWTITARRAHEMSVDHFLTDASMPPGKKGKCRYTYDHVPGDFSRGKVECHHADKYAYVYMVIPCMKHVRPDEKSGP